MRLSEAIRLGSLLKPQGEGQLSDGVHSCALGAALDAIGALGTPDWAGVATVKWPMLLVDVSHPAFRTTKLMTVSCTITDLNDTFHWTREQIADWVEQVELRHESDAVTVACEVA